MLPLTLIIAVGQVAAFPRGNVRRAAPAGQSLSFDTGLQPGEDYDRPPDSCRVSATRRKRVELFRQ
jgi:hypothetical protein